jgi:hypothetical protein
MRILTIIALTASAANIVYADGSDTLRSRFRSREPEQWHWVPSIGMVFNDRNMIEAGLLLSRHSYGSSCSDFPANGAYRAGVEYSDAGPAPIIAPKLGVDRDFVFIATRLSLVDYIQRDSHDLRLVPEIGFSFGPGLASILYGWNIALTDEPNPTIPPHRFAVALNLDRRLVQGNFFRAFIGSFVPVT